MDIYKRLRSGEEIDVRTDEDYRTECGKEMNRSRNLCFQINSLPPDSDKIRPLLDELFEGRLPASSAILAPVDIDRGKTVSIGKNVLINRGFSVTSTGSITIEDGVMIAPNVSIATLNHNFSDLYLVRCKPVIIKKNAWIGMGAMIMPGVTVGEGAVVAGGAVVTKNVEAHTLVGGNPAKFIKYTDRQ